MFVVEMFTTILSAKTAAMLGVYDLNHKRIVIVKKTKIIGRCSLKSTNDSRVVYFYTKRLDSKQG